MYEYITLYIVIPITNGHHWVITKTSHLLTCAINYHWRWAGNEAAFEDGDDDEGADGNCVLRLFIITDPDMHHHLELEPHQVVDSCFKPLRPEITMASSERGVWSGQGTLLPPRGKGHEIRPYLSNFLHIRHKWGKTQLSASRMIHFN